MIASPSKTYELVIHTDTPWEPVEDVDIISVMAELYDRNCPYSLMRKVFDEYERGDKALVFCGTLDRCEVGQVLFSNNGIKSFVEAI